MYINLIEEYSLFVQNNYTVYAYTNKGIIYKKTYDTKALGWYSNIIAVKGNMLVFTNYDNLSIENVELYYTDFKNYFVVANKQNYIIFNNVLDESLIDKNIDDIINQYGTYLDKFVIQKNIELTDRINSLENDIVDIKNILNSIINKNETFKNNSSLTNNIQKDFFCNYSNKIYLTLQKKGDNK